MEGIWEEKSVRFPRTSGAFSAQGVMKQTLVQLLHPNGEKYIISRKTRHTHPQVLSAVSAVTGNHRIATGPTASPSTATTATFTDLMTPGFRLLERLQLIRKHFDAEAVCA